MSGDTPVHLGGRAFDILLGLIERDGQVVRKADLIDTVWPDGKVDEGNLHFHVAVLRKALEEKDPGSTYVKTVHGEGYCFVAPIVRIPAKEEARTQPASSRPPLPIYASRMIGRDDILQNLIARLKAERFVTILGPGGIGKTILAVAMGRALWEDFGERVVFLDLAAIQDSRFLAGSLASALGLIATDDPVPGLIAHLRDKRTLLILDSCEHIVDQAAPLVERLLRYGAQTYILATSREALRIDGEHAALLPPLDCPPAGSGQSVSQILSFPAVQLLVERVAANGYRFEIGDSDSPFVIDICRKLDGIPLAIELAAGSIGAFGLRDTVAGLNSRIELLWAGRRTAPPRHQTLGAALDWSYNLLRDVERAVLSRFSVFVGNFTLEAALSVATGSGINADQVLDALTGLVAKSLVAADPSGAEPWYRLLDITRTFALAKRTGSEGDNDTLRRHAAYFLELLSATNSSPPSTPDGKLFSNFRPHLGNIRAALEWTLRDSDDARIGISLAAAAGHLFVELSLLTECRRWTERAISMLDGQTRGTRPEMELQAAFGFSAMHLEGNSKRAELALERSLQLASALGDPHYELRLLSRLHLYHSRLGRFRTALGYARRCEPVAKRIAVPLAIAEAHTVMGASRLFEGDCTGARHHLEAALVELPISEQIDAYHFGALDFRARVRIALAQALWLQGFPDQSMALARDTVEKVQTFNHPVTVCIVLVLAIRKFLWHRSFSIAERCVETILETANQHSLLPYRAVARAMNGEIEIGRGESASGVRELRAALETLHAIGYELQTSSFMMAVAKGLGRMGQYAEALSAADDAVVVVQRNGDLFILPELLRIKGTILFSAGVDGAEACFLNALELSARDRALAWELRAATSLARLRSAQGRREQARNTLAPVYDRFTEGFDGPDLAAARLLLSELG